MEGERSAGRWRVRPTEVATLASAFLLLLTAALPGSEEERMGVGVTFALTIAYTIVWFHVLPPGTFGRARYAIGGTVVQLITVYLIVATDGVRSPWFFFYLLPVLATVFSYEPQSTIVVAIVAALGVLFVGFTDPAVRTTEDVRDLLLTRVVGIGAVSLMTYMITGAMRTHRERFERQAGELREVLAMAEREAMTDPLTAVHNRRALEQALARAASRAGRDSRPYSVLLIDVDGLKRLNDRQGHAAGDRGLRLIATAATQAVRGYDFVARYGGDEFVVVLHDGGSDGARATAERVRAKARQLLSSDAVLGGTTISIGVASWRPGLTPEDLLVEADKEMYAAKHARPREPAAT
jgi:diguanylate cyclase (GGDEF)-like protein